MHPHHQQTIKNAQTLFQQRPEVQALLLAGSIAHGYATPSSDVDLFIILTDEAYQEYFARDELQFFNRELATYKDGYLDGKYLSESFLSEVAHKGSEPARFAFTDAQILFSRLSGLKDLLARISCYPLEEKEERLKRFYPQFEAWHWFCSEALKHQNRYLLTVAVSKLVLFGGRMILAHNERLYPYHKWFLRALETVPEKPDGLMGSIRNLLDEPSAETVAGFYDLVRNYRNWERPASSWPNRFMLECEHSWLYGLTPVDDL